jgi:diguanylate cyclase (GGDEF)-like protein
MFDIDHFKRINDTYGHDVGDKVIRAIADTARKELRSSDIFARWGGEEFVLLLPGIKEDTAVQMAERLRRSFEECTLESESGPLHFTASIGITIADNKSGDLKDIVKRADRALYRAKEAGRNRVML